LAIGLEGFTWLHKKDEVNTALKLLNPAIHTLEVGAETIQTTNNKTDWARRESLDKCFEIVG